MTARSSSSSSSGSGEPGADPPVMVRFANVEKAFHSADGATTTALRGVSFEIPRGQFCVIIGPSGSGKSTLLRLVNGMLEPSAGRVEFDGALLDRKNRASVQRRVGAIHQQFDLVPRLGVLDNVLAGTLPEVSTVRIVLGLWPTSYQQRACALLERVGMSEEHLYRPAARLSGGQQQRVAIARAFILDPAVVLADEPVASLDPATSRSVLALLRDASQDSGATVLCSLHQVDLAAEFADRIVAVTRGEIAYDGPPDGLTDELLDRVYGDARHDDDGTGRSDEEPVH